MITEASSGTKEYRRWRGSLRACYLAVFLFSVWMEVGFGQDALPLFTDPDAVDISLITVVPGNSLYDNFGHTALRVHDHASGQDVVFNWGIFDFPNPLLFGLMFYRGELTFSLGVYPYKQDLDWFRAAGRTTYEDPLQFTRLQKQRLLGRLREQRQPDKARYKYDYFHDNCATRPRDLINEALDGTLQSEFSTMRDGGTYRNEVLRHYISLPPIELILDVLMNSRIDTKISWWDRAFLPLDLREMLLAAFNKSVIEGNSNPMPLIQQSNEILHFQPPKSAAWGAHVIYLGAQSALLLGALLLLLSGVASGLFLEILGVAALLYGLVCGAAGIAMPLNWLFLPNPDTYHNVNMLLFFPLDAIYLYWGWRWASTGRAISLKNPGSFLLARHYQDLHLALCVLAVLMWLGGLIRQDISHVAAFILPPSVMLWMLSRRYGFAKSDDAKVDVARGEALKALT